MLHQIEKSIWRYNKEVDILAFGKQQPVFAFEAQNIQQFPHPYYEQNTKVRVQC